MSSGGTPKKVVYLFGAGATQAEISLADDQLRMLMNDVREGIINYVEKHDNEKTLLSDAYNELTMEGADVEHLITLYDSSGTDHHSQIARTLKRLFRAEIQAILKKTPTRFYTKTISCSD